MTTTNIHRIHRIGRTGLPLSLEITLAVCIKVTILFLIWKYCFSHPTSTHMKLPTPVVEQHVLNTNITNKGKP
ncbi:MAG: hypothetical protein K2P84_10615 [Undibacterium sp.]|nr:hypothetical protein [Undibacterium sp.]